MKKLFSKKKILASLFTLTLTAFVAAPVLVSAQVPVPTPGTPGSYGLDSSFNIGVPQKDNLKGTIANIINIILGFLGIIAVIIILAGGFKWMTAAGNTEKVGEAKDMIIQGIIGLVIIFASWAIASFVINRIGGAVAAGAA